MQQNWNSISLTRNSIPLYFSFPMPEAVNLNMAVIPITAVDSPHYQGAFQFEEAAEKTGYSIIGSYPFDPESFPGYSHTNTNDDDSALEKHNEFKTWIFELKKYVQATKLIDGSESRVGD